MHPYPNQSLSYTVGPGMPTHPGFVPQMQMHPQMMNAYGGQQPAVHASSQSDENVQGRHYKQTKTFVPSKNLQRLSCYAR